MLELTPADPIIRTYLKDLQHLGRLCVVRIGLGFQREVREIAEADLMPHRRRCGENILEPMSQFSITTLLKSFEGLSVEEILKSLQAEHDRWTPQTAKESKAGAGKYKEQLAAIAGFFRNGTTEGLITNGIPVSTLRPIVVELTETGKLNPDLLASIDAMK
jgi:hypothetical protein